MDTEVAAVREKKYFKRLEGQIRDMLQSRDYQTIIEELYYSCNYSTQTTTEIVRILHNIRKARLRDKKKLQKVVNHYAVEHENMLVLKP
jgi:hypothetical protein